MDEKKNPNWFDLEKKKKKKKIQNKKYQSNIRNIKKILPLDFR